MRTLNDKWNKTVDRITEKFILDKLGHDADKDFKNPKCEQVYILIDNKLELTNIAQTLFDKYRIGFEETVLKNIID